MKKIKVGIVGYGNLGKGLEKNIKDNDDFELIGIFSRRDPKKLDTSSPSFSYDDLNKFKGKIDVLMLCGSSAAGVFEQTIELAKDFNTVDVFDTHAKIPEYFKKVDAVNKENKTLSVISTGWDPGLFSINRALAEAVLPKGETYTFWGKGVSQGHSNAIRKIDGVLNAIQYTIPVKENLGKIRSGEKLQLTTREKHTRLCYVVADDKADKAEIESKIKTMPNYFSDYDTTVKFISEEELERDHSGMPHGGHVIRNGQTGDDNNEIYDFSLSLDSNPEFTSSVMIAYARACAKMHEEGHFGAYSVLDIPVAKLLNKSRDELIKMI